MCRSVSTGFDVDQSAEPCINYEINDVDGICCIHNEH